MGSRRSPRPAGDFSWSSARGKPLPGIGLGLAACAPCASMPLPPSLCQCLGLTCLGLTASIPKLLVLARGPPARFRRWPRPKVGSAPARNSPFGVGSGQDVRGPSGSHRRCWRAVHAASLRPANPLGNSPPPRPRPSRSDLKFALRSSAACARPRPGDPGWPPLAGEVEGRTLQTWDSPFGDSPPSLLIAQTPTEPLSALAIAPVPCTACFGHCLPYLRLPISLGENLDKRDPRA